jgi:hypothetical protein
MICRRPSLASVAVTLLASLAAPSPIARAQTVPVGIGFAQAEEGTWWCPDSSAAKALDCALDKCRTESNGQDCVATRWCTPAGWSGLMIAWLPEFHTTVILCGAGSQATVGAGLKAICDATEEFTRCDLIRVIDPDGNANEISDTSWPGPATGGEPAAD